MQNKELGVAEIFERIKAQKDTTGFVTCKRTPTRPLNEYGLPAIFVIEGEDSKLSESNRDPLGFPKKRDGLITLQVICNDSISNVKVLLNSGRKAAFTDRITMELNPVLPGNCALKELSFNGPYPLNVVDLIGMSATFELIYIDEGFIY